MNGVITQLPQNRNSESINNNNNTNNNNNSHQQHTKRSSDSFEFNRSSNVVSIQNKMGLHDEEANLMISALEIREKQAIELMIPFTSTFMVDYDEKLDKSKLRHILNKGYSRIPVYGNHNRQDILGLVRIKQLILLDKYTNKSLRDLGIRLKTPLVIHPSLNVFELLKEFRKGKSHMAFVTEQVNKLQSKFGLSRTNSIAVNNAIVFNKNIEIHIMGIITLEDVIEHIFNLEIYDEDDYEKMKESNTGMFVVSGNKENKKLEMIEECSKGNDESVNVNVNVDVDVYSSGNKDSSNSKKDNLLYESSLFNESLGNKKYNEKLII
jgi:metal transporter CNNM